VNDLAILPSVLDISHPPLKAGCGMIVLEVKVNTEKQRVTEQNAGLGHF
jgi:hypothetical protein